MADRRTGTATRIQEVKRLLTEIGEGATVRVNGKVVKVQLPLDVEVTTARSLASGELHITVSWPEEDQQTSPLVGVLGGSKSDFPVLEKAVAILTHLGVPAELLVVSAHRTPDRLFRYAEDAAARGIEVIVAGAGGAAHLPGMVAAKTHLPVIGVPIPTDQLRGLDSLLSIVQMPRGIPVATVAIGGAENAGLLAAQILAGRYPIIRERLKRFRSEQTRIIMDSFPEPPSVKPKRKRTGTPQ
jgi:5-(carboxyamino)imidazole ribonucleotide mutase